MNPINSLARRAASVRAFVVSVILLLSLSALAPTSRAAVPVPPPQHASVNAGFYYWWGFLDAQAYITERAAASEQIFSLRNLAQFNRINAQILRPYSFIAYVYLIGRADAYDVAADDAGEP